MAVDISVPNARRRAHRSESEGNRLRRTAVYLVARFAWRGMASHRRRKEAPLSASEREEEDDLA